MIHLALDFLKTELGKYLQGKCPMTPTSNSNDRVDYLNLGNDTHTMANGAVNLILINIEEERLLRPPDPYIQLNHDGVKSKVSPPVRLNLRLLFAAKFGEYEEAVKHLSFVIKYFQENPVFAGMAFPNFPTDIDKLIMELISLSQAEHNEIWSMLKLAYLPSVVYRARMLSYQADQVSMETDISEIETRFKHT